jgi:Fe-Mn family superoxide dismutase
MDTETVRLHHSKHHAAYVDKLNALLVEVGCEDPGPIEEFVENLGREKLSEKIKEAVRFNAGGHCNHSFFWKIIEPGGSHAPEGELLGAISSSFGTFEEFKIAFEGTAMGHFGSGWAWLCVDRSKKRQKDHLFVCSTLNHDTPRMVGLVQRPGIPILTLDLWEHAYYLKYNNRKAEYAKNFWSFANWNRIAQCYESAMA